MSSAVVILDTPRMFICTERAAVTSAALDSIKNRVLNKSFAEKFQPKFSTQQKNLC
jgi:hypothetical protein